MSQYIFYVNGPWLEADEHLVRDCVTEVFSIPDELVSVNPISSSVTVSLDSKNATDDCFLSLKSALYEQGYELALPPSRVDEVPDGGSSLDMKRQRASGLSHRRRGVTAGAFVATICAVLVVSVLATYALASRVFDRRLVDALDKIWDVPADSNTPTDTTQSVSSFPELELIKFLFDQYAIQEIDQEQLMVSVLKAYVAGTGDVYAQYYTQEELEKQYSDNQGRMEGIGVSVVNDRVEIGGVSYGVLRVIRVTPDTPALKAELRVGDCIYAVTDQEGNSVTVDVIGYDNAVSCVLGPAGTLARFTVLRFSTDGTYEMLPFEIERASIVTESVTGRVLGDHPEIGLVKISQFDLTTPPQFHATMDALIAQGCTKFIFDVRYNPGGALESVEAVLSTLLEKGDAMIFTVYNDGSRSVDVVEEVRNTLPGYETCDVTKADIGKYHGYEYVVLTNQYTASAGELFASDLRDHNLATLVGVTTYGKGCMQSTFDLSYFGVPGALKLTTAWYQPASGENYHGIGITPHIEVEMDNSLLEKYNNIYLIPDSEDNQLAAAIEAFHR